VENYCKIIYQMLSFLKGRLSLQWDVGIQVSFQSTWTILANESAESTISASKAGVKNGLNATYILTHGRSHASISSLDLVPLLV
jgi:hypothetical protein